MPANLIGAHRPTSKGLANTLREAKEMGCDALQVFTASPRQWKSTFPDQTKLSEFKTAKRETGLDHLISHDTYLVNLCHDEEEISRKSFETLRDELVRCGAYGIPLVVSHMGSTKGQDLGVALHKISEQTLNILAETPDGVTLLMETTAGQGSAVNSRFEEIAMLLELCKGHPKLGVCLDTCHVFAAGYDIRTKDTYEQTMGAFGKIVGFQNLKALHLNDSKKGLGSHVDRHANIGDGELGKETFRFVVNDPRLENIPMVVETPEADEGHERDLATLKSLRAS